MSTDSDWWTLYCPEHGARGDRETDWHNQCLQRTDHGRCLARCVTLDQARQYAKLLQRYGTRQTDADLAGGAEAAEIGIGVQRRDMETHGRSQPIELDTYNPPEDECPTH